MSNESSPPKSSHSSPGKTTSEEIPSLKSELNEPLSKSSAEGQKDSPKKSPLVGVKRDDSNKSSLETARQSHPTEPNSPRQKGKSDGTPRSKADRSPKDDRKNESFENKASFSGQKYGFSSGSSRRSYDGNSTEEMPLLPFEVNEPSGKNTDDHRKDSSFPGVILEDSHEDDSSISLHESARRSRSKANRSPKDGTRNESYESQSVSSAQKFTPCFRDPARLVSPENKQSENKSKSSALNVPSSSRISHGVESISDPSAHPPTPPSPQDPEYFRRRSFRKKCPTDEERKKLIEAFGQSSKWKWPCSSRRSSFTDIDDTILKVETKPPERSSSRRQSLDSASNTPPFTLMKRKSSDHPFNRSGESVRSRSSCRKSMSQNSETSSSSKKLKLENPETRYEQLEKLFDRSRERPQESERPQVSKRPQVSERPQVSRRRPSIQDVLLKFSKRHSAPSAVSIPSLFYRSSDDAQQAAYVHVNMLLKWWNFLAAPLANPLRINYQRLVRGGNGGWFFIAVFLASLLFFVCNPLFYKNVGSVSGEFFFLKCNNETPSVSEHQLQVFTEKDINIFVDVLHSIIKNEGCRNSPKEKYNVATFYHGHRPVIKDEIILNDLIHVRYFEPQDADLLIETCRILFKKSTHNVVRLYGDIGFIYLNDSLMEYCRYSVNFHWDIMVFIVCILFVYSAVMCLRVIMRKLSQKDDSCIYICGDEMHLKLTQCYSCSERTDDVVEV